MPFRFRRSVSIFKGLRLNFGKRGASLSLGGKGLSVNLSGRGARTTVGLPGTGLSYTTSTRSNKLPHKPDEWDKNIDILTDKPDAQTNQNDKQPDKVDPEKVNSSVDDFQYSEEDSSNLNVLFTTMLLVFIGGSAVLGLLYLVYYFFFSL
jgi:hypothetical protein